MTSAADIKKLREQTGAGMMDCKRALDDAKGDFEKAVQLVVERGLAKAEKKSDRETKEGFVGSYVHATGKVAAMVELLCETDFVARNDEFRALAKDIAMQVVAMQPETTTELLEQEFIKNPSETVEKIIKQASGKIGENIILGGFTRVKIGA